VRDFTILLVEDDFDVREALAETLRDEGYCVECAVDGEQALHYLRNGGRPGLILLDLMMPRMSGSEFRMAQKVDPQLRDLPVVLLTADGRMEEKARALETDGAIRKPINLDELFSMIRRFNKTAA
jgi:CheY-like chemotaxis protein